MVTTTNVSRMVPRPPSTEPIDAARFIPGTMLVSRYRIVSLLGRGGMGEVYRADDLKLGQPVALKFLPGGVGSDPARLARFHQEVRVARQVSHPNVCRVYDIGEADGQAFLSMEYVDGEDLASLLRRIGRLPADKAIQVARQLCAGLAAAHDRGVLHRDLKPANVLLDGRGHVRIADFGLATVVEERREAPLIAGTPGYMAPEQLDGHGATIRSDVYALGLILYEIFTGRAALARSWPPADPRSSESSRPTRPSTITPDIDPSVERVILRCLEVDPAQRPASALAVAAALPGGDPLAAALAAGETPSPDMVAAAGEVGALSPAASVTYLAITVIALLSFAVTSPQTMLLGVAGIDKEPAVLLERARTIAKNLGYENRPVDEASGFESDLDYLRYVTLHDRSPSRWDALKTSRTSPIWFWYRQSPRSLTSLTFKEYGAGRVTPDDPEGTQPGMLSMRIDASGRLVSFVAAPRQTDGVEITSDPPNWARVFTESGLPMTAFTAVFPEGPPTHSADTRSAWEGTAPDRPDTTVRVEAAAATNGRVVLFDVFTPSVRMNQRQTAAPSAPADRGLLFVTACSTVLVWAGAALLARRNMRRARGDRQGAFRCSVYLAATLLLATTIGAHHAADFVGEIGLMRMLLAFALYIGASVWLMYMAIEPYLRRVWPEVLIGWSRALTGRLRDPRVGRDVLVGACTGILMAAASQVAAFALRWAGWPVPILGPSDPLVTGQLIVSARDALQLVIGSLSLATFVVLVNTVVLVFFSSLFRSRAAAAIALGVIFGLVILAVVGLGARGGEWVFVAVSVVISATLSVAVLVRFGVLSAIGAQWVVFLTSQVPVTFDWSAPYAEASWLIVATILALTIYGFRTTLAGPIAVTRFEPQH
jgi:serine/threonine-protein kinase